MSEPRSDLLRRLLEMADAIALWRYDERQGAGDALPLACDTEPLLRDAASALEVQDNQLAMAQDAAAKWREDLAEHIVLVREQEAQLAEQDAALKAITAERDEFKALASVGTWHKDCRPNRKKAAEEIQKSQAVINKLADIISDQDAVIATLRAQVRFVKDGIAQHTAAFFWNDINYGLLHCQWRDQLSVALLPGQPDAAREARTDPTSTT